MKISITITDDNGEQFFGETELTKIKSKKIKEKTTSTSNFKGLSGGINFLMSQGFLDTPKTSKQVFEELKKEGYFFAYQAVDKSLRVSFVVRKKTIRRIKEDNVWHYVRR